MGIHNFDIQVECDKCGDTVTVFDVESKEEVRECCREDGWTFNVEGALCPDCSKEKSDA